MERGSPGRHEVEIVRRSDANRAIAAAAAAFAEARIHLPPLAFWRPRDWHEHRSDALEVMKAGLGWDVVEWRPGRFAEHGLVLFTLRNVARTDRSNGGDGYAEKIMRVQSRQRTPLHAHYRKMEDIVNRGGGDLVMELQAGRHDRGECQFLLNGVSKRIGRGGEAVVLSPGESITLRPGVYHAFYASGGAVIAGEISTRNDDVVDNDFREPTERFPRFEEDVPAERLVVADYRRLMSEWEARSSDPLAGGGPPEGP